MVCRAAQAGFAHRNGENYLPRCLGVAIYGAHRGGCNCFAYDTRPWMSDMRAQYQGMPTTSFSTQISSGPKITILMLKLTDQWQGHAVPCFHKLHAKQHDTRRNRCNACVPSFREQVVCKPCFGPCTFDVLDNPSAIFVFNRAVLLHRCLSPGSKLPKRLTANPKYSGCDLQQILYGILGRLRWQFLAISPFQYGSLKKERWVSLRAVQSEHPPGSR